MDGLKQQLLWRSSSAVTINALLIDNASASPTLLSGGSLVLNGMLSLSNGELRINGQSLTLNGTIATGSGTIRGAASSSLTIGGTSGGEGLQEPCALTATSPNNLVQNFTLNRTGASGSANARKQWT